MSPHFIALKATTTKPALKLKNKQENLNHEKSLFIHSARKPNRSSISARAYQTRCKSIVECFLEIFECLHS